VSTIGIDVFGSVIPHFYWAGEAASGITLHGLARCEVSGFIAATAAAAKRSASRLRRPGVSSIEPAWHWE
jgi:hypothetical protein